MQHINGDIHCPDSTLTIQVVTLNVSLVEIAALFTTISPPPPPSADTNVPLDVDCKLIRAPS
jgi:hypothetical protein